MSRTLRIASRGSDLALRQTEGVARALRRADPALAVEVSVFRTTGDRVLDVPLSQIGNKGLFTKELDDALLRGEADLAVHSLKDVPTRLPSGLVLTAVSAREDPRDVLVLPEGIAATLATLPAGARVGTGALRRRAQLGAFRPDLIPVGIRGNLNTRIAKLDRGEVDALLLAAAGVLRLGWQSRVSEFLSLDQWLSAPGQGALALVMRDEANPLRDLIVATLHDPISWACTLAERTLLAELEGGCQVPIGALAQADGHTLGLRALVADPDGTRVLRASVSGAITDAASLGRAAARQLLACGAAELLRLARPSAPAPELT